MRSFLSKLFDIKEGADFNKSVETISQGISLKGYNLWMLACAALLASIGLDTNSTAVIIGAMLVSPLMSPILGVGLSVAIHDKKLLLHSLRNLSLAVVISLVASCLYFLITPLGHVTEELEARTYPTLLDVGVALFGGFAGIISISRKESTNAVPGVAIATALMPPLCTAGFGIASGNTAYFLGAFYLFFINAVFIAMATYIIAKHLHFPAKQFENTKLRRQYSIWFNMLSIIAVLPSIWFLYTVYVKQQTKDTIHRLVISKIEQQGNEILKWELDDKDSVILVKIYHSGAELQDSIKNTIESELLQSALTKYRLQALRVNLTKEEVSQLSAEAARQMFTELQINKASQESVVRDSLPYIHLTREVQAFLPEIDSCYNGWLTIPAANRMIDTLPALFYSSPRQLKINDENRLTNFLKQRMAADSILLVYNGKNTTVWKK